MSSKQPKIKADSLEINNAVSLLKKLKDKVTEEYALAIDLVLDSASAAFHLGFDQGVESMEPRECDNFCSMCGQPLKPVDYEELEKEALKPDVVQEFELSEPSEHSFGPSHERMEEALGKLAHLMKDHIKKTEAKK